MKALFYAFLFNFCILPKYKKSLSNTRRYIFTKINPVKAINTAGTILNKILIAGFLSRPVYIAFKRSTYKIGKMKSTVGKDILEGISMLGISIIPINTATKMPIFPRPLFILKGLNNVLLEAVKSLL